MCAADLDLPTLARIEAAAERIRDTVPDTPTLRAHDLGVYLGLPLYLKAENLQKTGSFKVRGACHWLRTASARELSNGLITVSAGNHATALAWAAAIDGTPVTVVMPEGSSPAKIAAARELGAEVIIHGRIQEAVALCKSMSADQGLTLVHPYDDPRVMAGQGTVGLEILAQLPETGRILCPVGGGGLISGIGIAVKALKPAVEVIGVEPRGAATLRNAWDCNDAAAELATVDTIAASLAPVVAGRYTYAASRRVVDDIVTVGDEAIIEATRLLLTRGRLYVETGAAVGIAALLEKKVKATPSPTVAVITGGNMDIDQLCRLVPRT